MKKYTLFLCALAASVTMTAQTKMRIWQSGEDKVGRIAEAGDMTVNGNTIRIHGRDYQMSAIDSIVIVPQVTVAYSGTSATVSIPASVAADVTA